MENKDENVMDKIGDAVEDGKKPCPVCAGGKPGPVQLEEGEDISCFQDG